MNLKLFFPKLKLGRKILNIIKTFIHTPSSNKSVTLYEFGIVVKRKLKSLIERNIFIPDKIIKRSNNYCPMVFLLPVKVRQISRTLRTVVDCLPVGNASYPAESNLKNNA